METDFGALSEAQKRVWAVKVWQAGRDSNFWMSNGFVGKNTDDMSTVVHRVTELTETGRGGEAIMQLVQDLQSDGVVDDNDLDGNEESLVNDTQSIKISQLRHGVKNKGKMSTQLTVLRFRNLARDKLGFWLGDIIDELMFLTASGRAYSLYTDGSTRSGSQLPSLRFASDVVAASANRIAYGGDATGEGDIATADVMTWDLLVKVCAGAKRKRIKPIRNKGKGFFAVLMSTEQARDLKQDADYQTIVARAGPRGSENPLFTGAFAVVDGLILYEHQKVYNTLGLSSGSKWGSGSTVDGAQAMLLGSQALGLAQVGRAEFTESTLTDYGNKQGIGYGRMFGMLKPQWKSIYDSLSREDFGIMSIKTAAASTF